MLCAFIEITNTKKMTFYQTKKNETKDTLTLYGGIICAILIFLISFSHFWNTLEHSHYSLYCPVCFLYQLVTIVHELQAEWEALEIITHEWRLDNVEEKLIEEYSNESLVEEKDKHV